MPAGQSITSVAPKILWERDFSSNETVTISRFFEILFFHQIAKSEISYKYNEFSYNIKNKYEEKYRLSYIGYLFLFFGSLLWFYFVGGREKIVLMTVYFGFILTSIGYLVIILGVYLYVFQRSDLPSMIRYVNSITLPTFLLTFLIFFPALEKLRRKIEEKKLETIIVATLVFALIERPYLKPMYESFPKNQIKTNLEENVLKIKEMVDYDDTILIIEGINDNGFFSNVLKYIVSPNISHIIKYNSIENNQDRFLEYLKKSKYLWFLILRKEELELVEKIIKNKQSSTFFKIELESKDKIKLIPLI